jgi:hypothetical protein
METSRRYWVVSPNVQSHAHTVDAWRQASVRWLAAFMGWLPDDQDHRIGPRFAHEIQPGDVILIARKFRGEPETVGFGIVVGKFLTSLTGFVPHESFGSLRRLKPFVPLSRPPAFLPLLAATNQTAALHRLHPESNAEHKLLCRWMDSKLESTPQPVENPETRDGKNGVSFGPLASDGQLEYQVRTRQEVKQAKKLEAALVERYRLWVERQDRTLQIFRAHRLQCDAYEAGRRNLIEAKCSVRREYIRMAVGQLLDYSFHAQAEIGECNKAILVPERPNSSLMQWLDSLGIKVIWEEGPEFLDNANGQFT